MERKEARSPRATNKHPNAYVKRVFVTTVLHRLYLIKYELNIIGGGAKPKEL
jgi:hypothetical protein